MILLFRYQINVSSTFLFIFNLFHFFVVLQPIDINRIHSSYDNYNSKIIKTIQLLTATKWTIGFYLFVFLKQCFSLIFVKFNLFILKHIYASVDGLGRYFSIPIILLTMLTKYFFSKSIHEFFVLFWFYFCFSFYSWKGFDIHRSMAISLTN